MRSSQSKSSILRLLISCFGLASVLWCQTDNLANTSEPARLSTGRKTQPQTPERVAIPSQPTEAETEIITKIKRFFESRDEAVRREMARQIAANKTYDPGKLSGWLHSAVSHGQLKPGIRTTTVTLEDGGKRNVALRIPEGYTPDKRWPLVLAYHHTGGTGEDMIRILSRRLGGVVDRYVVAASTDYLPLNVESKRGWRPEQRLVLRELRKLIHVDSDRVYVTGFSQGCYASWSYATFYGDELAGAAPVACTFDAAPEITGLWELLIPNVANVPILHVWGSEDKLPERLI